MLYPSSSPFWSAAQWKRILLYFDISGEDCMHARYGAQILLLSRSNSWICVAEIYYNQKKNNTTTNNNNSRKKLLLSPCLFFALAVLDGWNHNFVRKLWQKIEMKRRKRKSRVFSELRKQLLDRSSWLPKLRDFMTSQRGFKKRLSLLAETDSTMYVRTKRETPAAFIRSTTPSTKLVIEEEEEEKIWRDIFWWCKNWEGWKVS